MKNKSITPEFIVNSFADRPLPEPGEKRERLPRSAKLVASLDCGSGPGGGDYRTYLISKDRKRSGWCLWLKVSDYDTGEWIHLSVAWGEPCHVHRTTVAAKLLLSAVLKKDYFLSGFIRVTEAGILCQADIDKIME
jgi:hypothetical protein